MSKLEEDLTVKEKIIRRIRSCIKRQEWTDEDFKSTYGILPSELEAQTDEEVLDIYDDLSMPC